MSSSSVAVLMFSRSWFTIILLTPQLYLPPIAMVSPPIRWLLFSLTASWLKIVRKWSETVIHCCYVAYVVYDD